MAHHLVTPKQVERVRVANHSRQNPEDEGKQQNQLGGLDTASERGHTVASEPVWEEKPDIRERCNYSLKDGDKISHVTAP